MAKTIRLLFPKDRWNTLHGYVFADRKHAQEWLAQPFVDAAEIALEEVELGPEHACRFCRGSGIRQDVRPIRRIKLTELV